MSQFERAAKLKAEGNAFFKNKEFENAIEKYTEAIALKSDDVTYFSNRSACYAALEEWEKAAEDGRQCIIVDKKFVKGYFRRAIGLKNSGNVEGAIEECKRGLGIDSKNADLKNMAKELEEVQRLKRVDEYIDQARELKSKKDYINADKAIENGLRIDPNNQILKALSNDIKPIIESMEKERLSGLNPLERIKEQGDKFFKAANFEAAIKQYTLCLDDITDKSSELALKCYGNRAACYKQLSNFDATIGDCTMVLEYRENDVKALVRRAQAFEACERYKSSLQDVRQVLALGVSVAGKASYDLANGMQHRLNRVIQQLKNG